MNKIKFWEDSPGSQSSGRLMFILKGIWNMFICTILIFKNIDPLIVAGVFVTLETVIAGQKLYANKQENDADKDKLDSNSSSSTI